MPFRVAITGSKHSPDIAQIAQILGKAEVASRLKKNSNLNLQN